MQLNELKSKTKRNGSKRVGRGRASGKGKTSGRGTKGQNARAGHKKRPDVREKLKKLPKLRGYKFASIQNKPAVINLSVLEAAFGAGDTINPTVLADRGLINVRRGKTAKVKVLGDGEVTKKFTIAGCMVSGS
ncbi:MAG TPA: uL15 family ribosomal protein, partial [Candidatus Paceibacterota bacterium]